MDRLAVSMRQKQQTTREKCLHSATPRVLALLACGLAAPLSGYGQVNPMAGNRGLQAEIEVTVRDSTGQLLAEPAVVELLMNGTPCGQQTTSNGRTSFILGALGKYTAVVRAAGYKAGQNEISVSEPVSSLLDVVLQPEDSGGAVVPVQKMPLLAPKAKAALDRAILALREDRLADAEKELAQAVKLAPNDPQVLYGRGLLELKKHEWTRAENALEKVTQMQPNSARALAALGMARCNQKKYAEAIVPLEKAVQLDPASGWQTRWSLGESYYHQGRYDDALSVARKAESKMDGSAPQLDLLVARALTAVGQFEESAKVLRELLSRHGEGPEAETARRFLERLAEDGKIARH